MLVLGGSLRFVRQDARIPTEAFMLGQLSPCGRARGVGSRRVLNPPR